VTNILNDYSEIPTFVFQAYLRSKCSIYSQKEILFALICSGRKAYQEKDDAVKKENE